MDNAGKNVMIHLSIVRQTPVTSFGGMSFSALAAKKDMRPSTVCVPNSRPITDAPALPAKDAAKSVVQVSSFTKEDVIR
eukprot:XP_001704349.1 Hypothetical protein GL50803_118710 [Giardia lamblia ATCC 50803]